MRLALFGASPDTPNMGVSALYMSAITSISQHFDTVEFVVFDNQLGRRETIIEVSRGKSVKVIFYGARGGYRYYRPENLFSMMALSKLGRLGAVINEGISLLDSCDAVLDVSGGDSFSDIYGNDRFNSVCRPKAVTINRGKPLILLPQTYGPFKSHTVRAQAKAVVSKATMAWARDENSFEALKSLLGDAYDSERHFTGVDLAFKLQPSNSLHLIDEGLRAWIECKKPETPLIGFNVSGLIYNNPQGAISRYGFQADYRQAVLGFLETLLKETRANIVLISHVMDQVGHFESDLAACMDVTRTLVEMDASRIKVTPLTLDQSQVKWLISQMDWFCGTRMHSTIAGLSSGVPTASISYSDKTKGVFDTCGQGEHVVDPRCLSTPEVISKLLASYRSMNATRDSLNKHLPGVLQVADEQVRKIANHILQLPQ